MTESIKNDYRLMQTVQHRLNMLVRAEDTKELKKYLKYGKTPQERYKRYRTHLFCMIRTKQLQDKTGIVNIQIKHNSKFTVFFILFLFFKKKK